MGRVEPPRAAGAATAPRGFERGAGAHERTRSAAQGAVLAMRCCSSAAERWVTSHAPGWLGIALSTRARMCQAWLGFGFGFGFGFGYG